MSFKNFLNEKLYFGSSYMPVGGSSSEISQPVTYDPARLKENPTANRCINMIVDAVAGIDYEIKDEPKLVGSQRTREDTVLSMINRQPNKFMDANAFWRNITLDLIYEGNAYILVDGTTLSILPARRMSVVGTTSHLITHYLLDSEQEFKFDQIIHIKDNNNNSLKVGDTRLRALKDIVALHNKMKTFQKNFFENNAMPGIVLMSPNTVTKTIRERKLAEWRQEFNPESGARKPAFLDGGIEIKNLSTNSFREMDFETSIQSIEKDIARTLGVPPILLEGGNNANITPNHRLMYLETIMPICEKIAGALSLHFGRDIRPVSVGVAALQPDLRDLANYVSTIVNGGIISPEEGRIELGFPQEVKGEIRVPANIAGSASNPSQGGRPQEPDEGE